MKRLIYSTFCLITYFSTAATAAPIDPANPPEGTFADEWYIVKMDRSRVGHMHSTVHRDGNHITTGVEMALTIRRGEAKLKVELQQETRELLDGTPVGFSSTMTMGMAPIKTVGRIRNGVLKLRDEQFGKKNTRELPFDMTARLAWGMYLEQYRRGYKPGTKYEVKSYDSSLRPDAPFITRVEVIGPDAIELGGRRVKAVKVRQTIVLEVPGKVAGSQPGVGLGAAAMQALGSELTTLAWMDEDGQILKMDTNLGGMFSISMVRATKAEAMAEVDQPTEMFLSTMIRVEQPVRAKARELTYKLSMKEDAPLPELPGTGMQRFKRINAHSGTLTVRRTDWESLKGKKVHGNGGGDDIYLKATLTADCDNPKIRKLAAKAVGKTKDVAVKADKLRRFVSDYVTDKNMNVGFATASEVVESQQGDCSEHAVLLAALCRAEGLPSRGVAGIVMIPGSKPAQFGYHMWTQVQMGGEWVDIDAALEQTDCDPTHIALALLDLGDSNLAEAGFKLLPVIGRLKLDLIESEKP